ncbi:MAG: hypothetical protein HY363_06045 [Candidatus Aenigmarchaeota archaeon]|nr:hypothetical protein [Candidatus Aenigmarchaeota archaeon]
MTCYNMKDKGASKYSVGGYAALLDADERSYGGAGENLEGLSGYGATQTYGQKADTYLFNTNYQWQRPYAAQPVASYRSQGLEGQLHQLTKSQDDKSAGIGTTKTIDATVAQALPLVYVCVPAVQILLPQEYSSQELEELEKFYKILLELQRKIGKQQWTMKNTLQGQKA